MLLSTLTVLAKTKEEKQAEARCNAFTKRSRRRKPQSKTLPDMRPLIVVAQRF
jgi:hypothetical protein